ncbi:hypothetical protein HDR61_00135 [bacterium]|nr:hypothetical protein [bacterium]
MWTSAHTLDTIFYMLNGIRIYASDDVWRQILTDLGAAVLDAPDAADINFDKLNILGPVSALELKSVILAALDNTDVLQKIFGGPVSMPRMQARIVTLLYKTGGMRCDEIKMGLGYSPNTATHTVDTAIYQLRRAYGRDFIINDNGVYRLGTL